MLKTDAWLFQESICSLDTYSMPIASACNSYAVWSEVHGFVAAGFASFLPWPLVREGRQQLVTI